MTTPPEALREMGADFIYAADALAETMRHLEQGMEARLKFLRRCVTENTDRLAKLKEEIGTLPEQIAKWDAEAARLESQTAEDLLRQALEAGRQEQPAPEPFRPGLPPERLRKVWAEWEDQRGDIVRFSRVDVFEWMTLGGHPNREPTQFSTKEVSGAGMSFRPHGATWARVEAMADEAERAVCDHTGHCDRGMSCGCKCHKPGLVYANDPKPAPPAPTLLDLTKLPPGTVCEATGQIARGSHVILPGERFAFAGSSTEFLARVRVIERDESFDVPTVVYARVVEVPR